MTSKKMTHFIIGAMILGIFAGHLVYLWGNETSLAKEYSENISILTDIFLRLIKMIIAPLVFSTLVVGMARMGSGGGSIGRITFKTFGWFLMMSILSLALGLIMVHILQPGTGLNLPLPDSDAAKDLQATGSGLKGFFQHIFPTSVVEAMAKNEILQIVVFSLFFGTAASSLGERAKALVDMLDTVAHIMLKITTSVMKVAPIAVFAAVSSEIALNGIGVIGTYAYFMASFYIGVIVLLIVILAIGSIFLGKNIFHLVRLMREPALLAFTTASSEAAYPKTLEQIERFGCSNRVASFVLPMGYSFNLDGSMMYCTFAAIFIAQIYGIDLSLSQQMLLLGLLLVTSKGMAGVPRASLVVLTAVLPTFNIPPQGVLLILAVDHFLDMARSAINVFGNAVASAVIAKSENELHLRHIKGKTSKSSGHRDSSGKEHSAKH